MWDRPRKLIGRCSTACERPWQARPVSRRRSLRRATRTPTAWSLRDADGEARRTGRAGLPARVPAQVGSWDAWVPCLPAGRPSAINEEGAMDARDAAAERRDTAADVRDGLADVRDGTADRREQLADAREHDADSRRDDDPGSRPRLGRAGDALHRIIARVARADARAARDESTIERDDVASRRPGSPDTGS